MEYKCNYTLEECRKLFNVKELREKIECAFALASLVKENELSTEYIIPDALDYQVSKTISNAINSNNL